MISPQIFYTANCDNCGKQWQDYDGGEALNYIEEMRATLMDSDWLIGRYEHGEAHFGKHYCPDCYSFDDKDKIELKDTF